MFLKKNYVSEIVPKDILDAAIAKLPSDFTYNTITYDTKTQSVRFDEAPDFDTATEPRVGKIFTVNKDGTTKVAEQRLYNGDCVTKIAPHRLHNKYCTTKIA